MLIAKAYFGITENSHFAFILGGLINGNNQSSSCEKYDIIKNTWMSINNLNFA